MGRKPLQLPDAQWCRRWLVTEKYDVLHRTSRLEWDEYMGIGKGDTLCGLKKKMLFIPGIFSRMGRRRCPECCRLARIPEGNGAPWNTDEVWKGA